MNYKEVWSIRVVSRKRRRADSCDLDLTRHALKCHPAKMESVHKIPGHYPIGIISLRDTGVNDRIDGHLYAQTVHFLGRYADGVARQPSWVRKGQTKCRGSHRSERREGRFANAAVDSASCIAWNYRNYYSLVYTARRQTTNIKIKSAGGVYSRPG